MRKKITHHFRGIYNIYPKFIKETQKSTACNQLDLESVGLCQKSPLDTLLRSHYITVIIIPERVEKQMTKIKKLKKKERGPNSQSGGLRGQVSTILSGDGTEAFEWASQKAEGHFSHKPRAMTMKL